MKFKVGDRIKRVSGEIGDRLKIGDIGIIKAILIGTNSYRVINERTREVQTWGDDYIDIEPSQTIVIYPKGLETIALLKEGNKVIKQATAKCNPSDKYDFNIGAKLAFDRLMGEQNPMVSNASSFDWEGFKSGKFAVHCDTEEKAMEFLKECDEHGIRWMSGDKTTSHTNYSRSNTYGILYFGRGSSLTYSISHELYKDDTIINYTPSKPAVKEVKRPAKVGEWIKIIDGAGSELSKVGDLARVTRVWYGNNGVDYITDYGVETGGFHKRYVVLENYQPEATKALSDYTDKELINELSKRLEDKQ